MKDEKKKKKGFFAAIKESMSKTGGCCGPGETCGGPEKNNIKPVQKDLQKSEKGQNTYSLNNYFCAFYGKKIVLEYFHCLVMIEYCRLTIEYLWNCVYFLFFAFCISAGGKNAG